MPDGAGNIKGIALSGKAGETLERILSAEGETLERRLKDWGNDCGQRPETCKWGDACADCTQ